MSVKFSFAKFALDSRSYSLFGRIDQFFLSRSSYGVDNLLFRNDTRFFLDFCHTLVFYESNRNLYEVADHRFHVATDVTDFGKFRCFDLDERRLYKFSESSCDLGFTYAGRSLHNYVLRSDFFADFVGKLRSSIAVSQRDRDRAFRFALSDNVSVKFRNYLFRRKFVFQALNLLDRNVVVGENPDFAGNFHCFHGNAFRTHFSVSQ